MNASAATAGNNGAAIVGIDVSKWQGEVDFPKIKNAGYAYVFVKVSQGATGVDPQYAHNIAAARAAGLAAGSYHFYSTDHDAASQFANLSAHLDLKPGDLPPVVDIEVFAQNSLPNLAAELKQFLDAIENRYKAKPILYSGLSFAAQNLNGFGAYPLWLAEYNDAPAPRMPTGWTHWTFWQYSQTGHAPGVNGNVDLDRFNGDAEQFRALLVA
jgi:lysozyme